MSAATSRIYQIACKAGHVRVGPTMPICLLPLSEAVDGGRRGAQSRCWGAFWHRFVGGGLYLMGGGHFPRGLAFHIALGEWGP